MSAISVGVQLLNVFKDPILSLGKEFQSDILHAYNNGLRDYINNFYLKYSKTKTFIYRDEKIDFYDVYYPISITNRFTQETISKIDDLNELFETRQFITIIGNAGSGKSMLMKHIFLSTISQNYRIPLVVELRNLNDFEGTITDYISKMLVKSNLAKTNKITEKVLSEGNFIFLFDGYDEIYSASKNKITNDIEEFVDTYNKNIYVITSRPGANSESLQRFDNFYVKSLLPSQISEFVHLQFKNHDNKDSIGKILSVIKKPENKDYKDYLSNPLLLSMFIFTFNNYPELPKSKSKFYWNVFDTLCTKHDSFTKKGFWLHERKSSFQNEDFENLLKWFAYISIFKGKYNFDIEFLRNLLGEINTKLNLKADLDDLIYDLTVSIAILIQDGTEYTFPHKSLQEYFTAYLIKGLNDEQKKQIYENKFLLLKKYTNGGNLNLYKLCFEMDKFHFTKYFLLPTARIFLSELDNSNHISLTKSFIKQFDLTLTFKKENEKFLLRSYSYNSLLSDSFLSFFNIPDVIQWDEINQHKSIETIKEHLERTLVPDKDEDIMIAHIDLANDDYECLLEFIKESKIGKNFKKIHDDLVVNVSKLEQELTDDTVNTKELLDI